MDKINLPKHSLPYVLYQRTGYLKNKTIFKFLTKIGRIKPLYKSSVFLKSFLYSNAVEKIFTENMCDEYETMAPYLPTEAKSILDIGSGVAGIDVYIGKHFNNNINISLLDKSKVDKQVYYHFENKGSFYNSLSIAKEILISNGQHPDRIHLIEANDQATIDTNQKFDIVISLISWGFHYPVVTYLNEVYEKMESNGILIIDIRKNTAGEEELKSKFQSLEVIHETNKYKRILVRK